jgi:iron complex outermembrane receptor protein
MTKSKFAHIALLGCASILASATSALAQDTRAAAEGAEGTPEIVVTATRRAEALIDAPVAVDVVSGESIAKLNLFDVKEIQNTVPGLTLENTDGRSNIATLRGI